MLTHHVADLCDVYHAVDVVVALDECYPLFLCYNEYTGYLEHVNTLAPLLYYFVQEKENFTSDNSDGTDWRRDLSTGEVSNECTQQRSFPDFARTNECN